MSGVNRMVAFLKNDPYIVYNKIIASEIFPFVLVTVAILRSLLFVEVFFSLFLSKIT